MRTTAKLAVRVSVVFGLLASTAIGASAQFMVLDFTTPTNNFTNLNWSLGWRFTTNTPINITAFCYYDDFRDGMLNNHEVALYDTATEFQFLRIDVLKTDPLVNGNYFRCHTLPSPISLPAGGAYIITGSTRTDNYTWNPGGLSSDPAINLVEDRFEPSNAGGFALYPHSTSGNASGPAWFGPSFQIDA